MEDEIAELTNQSFSLYKLGPLYKFFSHSFEYWEKSLAKHLLVRLKLNNVDSHSQLRRDELYRGELLNLRVDGLSFDSLASYDTTIRSLKITIEIHYYKKGEHQIHVFFLVPSSYAPPANEPFTYYPLVLAKAPKRVVEEVGAWLEQKFFSKMKRLFIPPDIMQSSIQVWVRSIMELKKQYEVHAQQIPAGMFRLPLYLEYTTADPTLSNIEFKLSQKEASNILELVPENQFYESLCHHIANWTGIMLDTIVLHRVSSSLANLRKDGTLKIDGHAYKAFAVELLQNLIELAANQMY